MSANGRTRFCWSGTREASPDTLKKIAEALKVTIDEIV